MTLITLRSERVKRRKARLVRFLTSQCRRFGSGSVLYSQINRQASLDLVQDWANPAPTPLPSTRFYTDLYGGFHSAAKLVFHGISEAETILACFCVYVCRRGSLNII